MALHLKDVSFQYRRGREVFEHLDVTFRPGRTVLLGPNGAGKSTMLALLANALDPVSGHVELDGAGSPRNHAQRRSYRKRVAWLPQTVPVFPGLNVREQVAYAGWLKGLSRAQAWVRSVDALELVDLSSSAQKSASSLSGGHQRRMGIASALVHDAEAILLDEPTAGLDPGQRARFREILLRIAPSKILVVSTHQTEDISDTYERVFVLTEGRQQFDGTVSGFTEGTSPSADMRDRVVEAYGRFVESED